MSAKKIQDFQNNIKKNKNPEAAVKLMIKFGDYLIYNSMYNEALAEFEEAKKYAVEKLPADCVKKSELEYKIDRGLLCGLEKDSPLDQLNEFIEKYKNAKLDIKLKQNFAFTVANSLIYMKKFDQAAEYLTKSMELLNQFPKKDDNYELRKAQLYGLKIEAAVGEKNFVKTMELLNHAFACKKLKQDDPNLYFFLLGCKRKHVPREEKMEISLKMCEHWQRLNAKLKADNKLDAYYNLFEDYCYKKDFEKAEEMCWKIYSDKECLKLDKKEVVKKSLIFLYKLPKLLKDIEQFKNPPDYQKIVYIYKKIADELYSNERYELAYEYYEKMKEYLINLPENEENAKLRHYAVESLFLCLDEVACCQKDCKQLLQYLEELLPLQESLKTSEDILVTTQLDYAVIKSKCDNFTFEEKKKSLLDVKEKLTTDIQISEFYLSIISLIKSHPDEGDYQYLAELEEELKIYKEKIKAYKDPPRRFSFIPYTDDDVEMSDEQILKIFEEKWKHLDEIQFFKEKLDKINAFGESELFKAISTNSNLEHIKFLIEECGYLGIVEKADNSGVTPFYFAVSKNQIDIVNYFIEKGANINAVTDQPEGTTPLMEAILQRNPDMIELLLEKGANPIIKNINGHTALDLLTEQIRNGNMHASNTPGPKSAKKEKPIPTDVLRDLKRIKILLKEAENEYQQNHDEPSQQNLVTHHQASPNESNRSRKRRHENIND